MNRSVIWLHGCRREEVMMIKNCKVVLIVFGLFFLFMGKVAAQASPVEFRFVCEGADPGCSREFVTTTGEELWVENNPVMDVDDVESASLESQPEMVGGIKVGVQSYTISINFKDLVELEDITSRNTGKRLGIFIDHKLMFAPTIMEGISSGQIGMSVRPFESVQVKQLVDFINNAVRKK